MKEKNEVLILVIMDWVRKSEAGEEYTTSDGRLNPCYNGLGTEIQEESSYFNSRKLS